MRIRCAIIAIFAALLTVLAFTANYNLITDEMASAAQNGITNIAVLTIHKIRNNIGGYGSVWSILYLLLVTFYYKVLSKCFLNYPILICSIILSIFMAIGKVFEAGGSLNFFYYDWYQVIFSVTIVAGFTFLFYLSIFFLFRYFPLKCKTSLSRYMEKHFILKCMFGLIIIWSPTLISFLPGSAGWDGLVQLKVFFGERELTNHHPIFTTLIYGFITQIGILIVDQNFGLFLITVFHTLVLSYSFSKVLYFLYRRDIGKKILWSVFIYYSIIPVWAAYAQFFVKDTLYVAVFILYLLSVIQIVNYRDGGKISRHVAQLFIYGLLICLIRHNGSFVVFITAIVLIIYLMHSMRKTKQTNKNIKVKLKICISLLSPVILVFLLNNVILYNMNIRSSNAEALSIPLQQISRYIIKYKNEITKEERNAIEYYLDFDEIENRYNPNNSDPIKNTLLHSFEFNSDEGKRFIQTWWNLFLKHPMTFVEATLNNTYGYFYPDEIMTYETPFYFGIHEKQNFLEFSFLFNSIPRRIFHNLTYIFYSVPVLGLLQNPAVHTWILLILATWILKEKRYRYLIILLPSFLTLCCCFISPINGAVRYALPYMAATPVIICICINAGEDDK